MFVASVSGAVAQGAENTLRQSCAANRGQACNDPDITRVGDEPLIAIPYYDVETQCRRAGLGVRVCVEAEQSDYDAAKLAWPHLSLKARQACAGSFRTEGARRYASFMGCVYFHAAEERYATERRQPPPPFRY